MTLSNFTIRQKLIGLVLILALGIVTTSCLAFYFSYQDTRSGKQEQIKSIVQSATSQIVLLNQRKRSLEISDQEFDTRLHDLIYSTAYGEHGYLYLLKNETQIYLHPKRSDLEGQYIEKIDSPVDSTLMINGLKQLKKNPDKSHGWLVYWPKPGSQVPVAKLIYAQHIPDTDFILSTGVYIDDLLPLYIKRALSYLIITLTVLFASIAAALLISRNIVRPIINLSSQMEKLSEGDTDQTVRFTNHRDEIGQMARTLERFREYLIENKRLRYAQEHVQFLENFDPVTRLYNRRAMGESLEREIIRNSETQGQIYFLFIRLDLLRNLTIELGDEQRDQILIETANRLKGILSINHRLARLSEGCFGLMLINKPEETKVDDLIETILQAIECPIKLQNLHIQIVARIGVTSYPEDGDQQFELIGRSEIAAKTARKQEQSWLYFSQIKGQQVETKMELWQDLSTAIDENQLYLVFQPLFDLNNNAALSAETLLRWNHPDLGPISPAVFVPLAEQSGLISRLDYWVLDAVAKQCRKWLNTDLVFPKIAINLSGISFLRSNFENKLHNIFKQYNVPLQHIELELTEGVLIEDLARIQDKLHRVRETGASISIDDFGTGYSSLSRIKNLPIDHIKIDKSFIDDLDVDTQDLKIVQAIILMAQGLQLKVVAEGVETELQLSILREAKCDIVQGYLLSRPLSVSDFEALIDEDLIIEGD
ncbi:EAL domain-containing protein [Neptuniibacter sp. 1_MG-2023]|jgi:diguanylate cyclase (GGDEF)-like protein|uniref:EAL domain-containing protein n=1 Tax=Neptuniibacter sp. 1_MG-2023 TaxID=3062662 RepID=UPI0026E2811B|nr:EAL domain-containing protein [Neptuniibacter sp. 1_MG-2023]MDO6594219.1 EAL domain-containing protein [Neptuniibacter sp. 1_MG-2023]